MNGHYTIANPGTGPASFSTENKDYAGGVEYFDVWSPEIRSRYSQVYWTMMSPVPLPDDIIKRFDGKVMAITGVESDQVMVTPGKPDVSVPITWAYNHHYGHYINGKDSVMEQVELQRHGDRADVTGHATPGDQVWVTRPKDDDSNPYSKFPASTVFATGNGGEYRKSFHSYPAPYAQLIESPVSWRIQPMQIDTKNRDGSMAEPGMPFKAGPAPRNSKAPVTGPDAVYSGLLECPCTDRITRSLGVAGAASARTCGVCPHVVDLPADCKTAAAKLAAAAPVPSATSKSCGCGATHPGTFLSGMATGSPKAGWGTLVEAETWCCAHATGCGGVTLQNGSYTARAGTTPTPYSMKGLNSWVRSGGGGGGGGAAFNFSTGADATAPAGCSLSVSPSTGAVTGYFNTAATGVGCGGKVGQRRAAGAGTTDNGVGLAVAMDESANTVEITLEGPAGVWFGVGFNAGAMADLPWAVVIDGAGKVSEHKLADHAPGVVLQPSVSVVSVNTTAAGRTIVVLTRSLKLADYGADYYDFDVTTTALSYIAAVGSGTDYAYHKSHAVATLDLFAVAAPTCICAAAPPAFGKTASGTVTYSAAGTNGTDSTVGFGKNCVGECDPATPGCTKSSSLIDQRNPTCDVRTYNGGLSCCHHMYYLLDKDQEIPEEPLVYRMKQRFYFQEFEPDRHKQLYRWHWQTAIGAGEYDVPKCAPGTAPEECVHTIHARIRVSDFANGPCDWRSGLNSLTPACGNHSVGFKPIFLGGHCHAPTCLSMELFNADTNESICRNVPTFGNLTAGAVGGDKRFEEDGYIALPPCVWSEDPTSGLLAPPLLTWDTNLTAIKRCNSTFGHTGEMARWQGHGIIV